jgi:heat shock protein HslJ
MGCNNLSFGYIIGNDTITFSKGIATRMFCQDMSLENDFTKDISLFNKFRVDGHKLILTSNEGEKIEFIAQDWD